jgi:hypothetical protein
MNYYQMHDMRGIEGLKAMGEMMNSMMAFQHNNFKAMMESHTKLMDKMIDKVCSKRRKRIHHRNSDSSFDGGKDDVST